MKLNSLLILAMSLMMRVPAVAQESASNQIPTFHVKYVTADSVYIDAGAGAGLSEGYVLTMKRPGPGESPLQAAVLAELVVTSVASASAVCEIRSSQLRVEPGDLVFLSAETRQLVARANSNKEAETYPQVITFTGFDPLEEELHQNVPKPPLPEVNRVKGRIGFDYDTIRDRLSGSRSDQKGLVVRVDITRIGSSHWRLTGYWRGRLNARSSSTSADTLRETLNRVYQIGLQYESPTNPWVAGAGRLLLPWAASISTFDGGYFGRKLTRGTTAGIFAGSTPNPTAWNYEPNREIGGAFVSNNHGSFEGFHRTHTAGIAATRIHWQPDRQYAFAENEFSFRKWISIHHNAEGDYLSKGRFSSARTVSLTRSYLTLRVQPVWHITFDASHNYFRVLPTFDPVLLSTGLLDNLLFQGLSGGVRVDLPHRISVYSDAGQSHATGDQKRSWNTMLGTTIGRIPLAGIRVDLRRSRFSSSSGSGRYDSVSIVREISGRFRLDAMAGVQRFQSSLIAASPSRFLTANADLFLGRHIALGVGGSVFRGTQSYNQVNGNIGYRF